MTLDDHIEGTFDPNAPFNQPDPEPWPNCISDAIEEENDEAYTEHLFALRREVDNLREYARQSDNILLLNKLTLIYNKL